ncbi:Probable ABC transporter ATP-binding protein in ycf23-apcF intergenic region [Geodia barretti]|uniref:Probable ABC transporter ATP-binding protein in ycf23-apcF intergenic region n=1 Tax=Geodia barretti TaxID=519541 RepID=A0AA35T778_GEOBA|nr:Probable ABC transporter ATP-binding protein in ycf23-apcF intergenic region [Geodia barretti]
MAVTDPQPAGAADVALRASGLRPGPLIAGLAAVVVAVVAGLTIGPVDIGAHRVALQLLDGLPGLSLDSGLSDTHSAIVEQIRLPRVALGLLVGATLSMSGAAYQGAFRNPLADPYLLGIAAGAGLGATIAITSNLGDGAGALDPVPLAAFAGALISVAVSYVAGHVGGRSTASLILAGIAVASFLTACQTYVLQANSDAFRQIFAWILGRIATSGWSEPALMLPYFVVTTRWCCATAGPARRARRRRRGGRRARVGAPPVAGRSGDIAVSVRSLEVTLDGTQVLRGVDLAASKGEWVNIIGPNGAGKTTLLRALLGLVSFDGEIDIDGLSDQRRRVARLACLPTSRRRRSSRPACWWPTTSCCGAPRIGASFAAETATDRRVAAEVLDRLDLGGFGDRSVQSLSGGERQRAVHARRLAQQADVLLLDEPTTALDLGHQQDVLDLVDALRRERGLTVIDHCTTHAGGPLRRPHRHTRSRAGR